MSPSKDPLLFLQLAFSSTFFAGLFQASLILFGYTNYYFFFLSYIFLKTAVWILCWQLLLVSWIMKRLGERMLVVKWLDFFSRLNFKSVCVCIFGCIFNSVNIGWIYVSLNVYACEWQFVYLHFMKTVMLTFICS